MRWTVSGSRGMPTLARLSSSETTANLLKSEASDLARELFGQLRGVVA
jgi:hypothetical protein